MISLSNADARMLTGILQNIAESPPEPGIKARNARRVAINLLRKIKNKTHELDKTRQENS